MRTGQESRDIFCRTIFVQISCVYGFMGPYVVLKYLEIYVVLRYIVLRYFLCYNIFVVICFVDIYVVFAIFCVTTCGVVISCVDM